MVAVHRGSDVIVATLLKCGSDLSLRDYKGFSVFEVARKKKRSKILNQLEKAKLMTILCSALNVPRLINKESSSRLLTKDILRSISDMLFF